MSQTLRYRGECAWCRQVDREKARGERRDWVRGRLMDAGNGEGQRAYGRGRFSFWG
jgi:hypothetical protein